ncbi:heterokaryon incompatibility protein-domain-containing protein [Xylariaceae sp. AK1471]|nr:heterokaryon incompatibility protein-domain-containing protein [Xylariaceae sp. AK1471]
MVFRLLAVGAAALGYGLYLKHKDEQERLERSSLRTVSIATSPTTLSSLYERKSIPGRKLRVLVLHAGNFHDKLFCELEVGYVDSATYEALSYAWRDPPNTQDLVVNGIEMKIRDNLYWALQHLRPLPGASPRRLWVDAICINQAERDNPEKDRQLALMGDIYRQATQVLAWLGTPDAAGKSRNALTHFRAINDGNLDSSRMLRDYQENGAKWYDFGAAIMTRDWFTRIWTVQEFICAKKVHFVCGFHSVPGELVGMIGILCQTEGLPIIPKKPRSQFADVGIANDVAMLIMFRELWKSGESMQHLMHWIVGFNHRECSDAKDQIYAFLALDKTRSCPIKPDYIVSWQTLYRDTTRYIIDECKALDFIAFQCGYENVDASLPSWVPNLHIPIRRLAACLPRMNVHKPIYQASGIRPPKVSFDGDYLFASGRKFKEILELTDVIEDEEKSVDNARKLAFKISNRRPSSRYPCPHGHTYQQAFARTMVMDMNIARDRCVEGQNEGFGEWKESWGVPSSFQSDLSGSERLAAFKDKKGHQERMWCIGRKLAILEADLIGLVPQSATVRDVVIVLEGATMPVVFRPRTDHPGCYRLIGACYIHGIMDGEVFSKNLGTAQKFCLR